MRNRNAWGEVDTIHWAHVARGARESGAEVHNGMIFGSVVDKNSDLSKDDKRRMFNGRVVTMVTRPTSKH